MRRRARQDISFDSALVFPYSCDMTYEELRQAVLQKVFTNDAERETFLARWREIRPETDPEELLSWLADGLILSALSELPPAGTA